MKYLLYFINYILLITLLTLAYVLMDLNFNNLSGFWNSMLLSLLVALVSKMLNDKIFSYII